LIVHANCLKINWPKSDLIITSPPYKDKDGYTEQLIRGFAERSYESLNDDSLLFCNFGHLAAFKSRPFRVAMMLEDAGFNWIDTITWVKNHYRPLAGKRRVNNLSEFVFMMGKGNPTIDRLSIGVPYQDKSNIKRWKATGGNDLKCGGNVWNIPYETVRNKKDKLHNDRFPVELPTRCIKLSAIPKKSLVLDPFVGSGTTALSAKLNGMEFFGTELDEEHFKTATRRVSESKS